MKEPKQWYDDSYDLIHELDGARDAEIDRLKSEIEAHNALDACMATPGWETYHAYLVRKFDGLNSKLIYGNDLTEGERFHLQGRLLELKEIVSDREDRKKSIRQARERLDTLLSKRKNLEVETQT